MVEYCMFTDVLLVLAFKGMCHCHSFLFFYYFIFCSFIELKFSAKSDDL